MRLRTATLAVFGTVLLEFLLVSLLNRAQLASVWEFQYGAAGLLPILVVGSMTFGGLGALVWYLVERGAEPWPRRALALAVFCFGALVLYGIGGGRHLSALSTRLGFALGGGLGGALALYWLGPSFGAHIRHRSRRVGLALAAAVIVLELGNRLLLVRLYPAFHAGLAALTLILAAGVPLALSVPQPARGLRAPIVYAAVLALGLGLAKPAAGLITGFDNFRILMLEQGAIVHQAMQLTAWLEPPAQLRDTDCASGTADCWTEPVLEPESSAALDWAGRDLLLITVDALRADHVGTYGYGRPITPNLDRLAEAGTTFLNAYAPTPHTSYSITSLMTGKYMRPLILQGAGQDSDTWAKLLRTYGYRTAGFYPPAVFFIDQDRFLPFSERALDFEYKKVEFAEGQGRIDQVSAYLAQQTRSSRVFLWVHFFGPHEPYENHPGFEQGERDIDRYDSEIAFVDDSIGRLVRLVRSQRPNTVVIVTSDHGEEFGEHGGRYHGTTVYEEQVHVPMLIHGPGVVPRRRIEDCVQTIDLLPTVLSALDVPRPPRIRGKNLGPLIAGQAPGPGFAVAETETQTLLAEGGYRLVCARRIGACQLFDLERDPDQRQDISRAEPTLFERLRLTQQKLSASHGVYETHGLRAEGKGWPAPILRGVTGDGDAAPEIAELLDDADVAIRQKSAELLFELGRPETAGALRLALGRAEDEQVRRYAALALTRLGEGAPLAFELAKSEDQRWRRLAALALAESGDHRGADTLVLWWRDSRARDYNRSRQILSALAKTRSKDAVWPLVQSLGDVRLRPYIAETLAAIGDEFARGPLGRALSEERYQSTRVALTRALVDLGAEEDLARPLVHFLGVPDALPGGLGFALKAGIVENIGGPNARTLKRLQRESDLGVAMQVVVPRGGNGTGVRLLVRARTRGEQPGSVYVGSRENMFRYGKDGRPIITRDLPRLDAAKSASIEVPVTRDFLELYRELPKELGARAGRAYYGVVFADHEVEIEAIALVPLSDELPPPAPVPWRPGTAPAAAVDGPPAD